MDPFFIMFSQFRGFVKDKEFLFMFLTNILLLFLHHKAGFTLFLGKLIKEYFTFHILTLKGQRIQLTVTFTENLLDSNTLIKIQWIHL